MYDKLMKHLEKKGKKLSPVEQKAKMGVVKELSSQAGEMLSDKLKGLKKVTVASDSKEGLKKGLDKAKEVIHGRDPEKLVEQAEEEMGTDLDKDMEEGEDPLHAAKVLGEESMEDCSPEELDAKIKELEALKAKKLAEKN